MLNLVIRLYQKSLFSNALGVLSFLTVSSNIDLKILVSLDSSVCKKETFLLLQVRQIKYMSRCRKLSVFIRPRGGLGNNCVNIV